ncbi:EamA family transporter [Lachnospiraceae bacterium MD329]|jgi:drug/metabolite transporter (DMT)-like permease|nr:EamA family transporter [Lachnospiraceae bacterium MD329]
MNQNTLTKTPVVCALAILCCILWGSATPSIKIGYELFNIASGDTASQILFAGMRFILAGILTILFGSLLSRKALVPKKKSIPSIVKLAMVQTILQYVFFYIGHAHTSGVKAAIINGSNVFLSILFAVLIFKYEKMTWVKLIGCIAGFAGIVIINLTGGGIDMNMSFLGEGAILISAAAYALSSGMIKKYSQDENPVVLSGYQFFLGGLVMSIAGLIAGGKVSGFTFSSTMLLIYLAMISSVAYTVWGVLLKHNPVAKVTVFGFTNPMFGVLLSAIFLGEKNQAFGIQGIIALVLVCFGIFIINKAKK